MTPITALGSRYGIQGALGRSVKRVASSASTWWDLNGTITSCVAAYQAIGAASQATSYVNLFNPGTYDLTATGSPSWSAEAGWGSFLTTAYLNTGIAAGQLWTAIGRHTNSSTGAHQFLLGTDSLLNRRFYLFPIFSTTNRAYGAGGYVSIAGGAHKNGVSAIAGRQGYFDGSADGGLTNAAYSADAQYPLLIGIANGGTLVYPWGGNIQAVAFYSKELTATQIGLLTTAMNAL